MKKTIVFIFSAFLFLGACKKDKDTTNNTSNNTSPIDNPPATFSKKILIEAFTGEWNPNCPTGDDTIKAMLNLDDNVLCASIHQGDWLALNTLYTELSSHLGGVPGFPRAAIDRLPAGKGTQLDSVIYSIYNYRVNVLDLLLNASTNCGLAMTTKEKNNNVDINVYIGYSDSIKARTRLTVYLLEDSIKAVSQANADSNYLHHHVVRKVLTQNLGDSIEMFDKKMITKTFSFNISGVCQDKENAKIVAFINTIGDDFKQNQILNARWAKLNETKNWD